MSSPTTGPPPPYPLPADEADRLVAVAAYGPPSAGADPVLDGLVRLAAQLCAAPIAVVSVVGSAQVRPAACVGIPVGDTPRGLAFCSHAVARPHDMLVVEDATADARFAGNPFVLGEEHIRFYAGVPLRAGDGQALGTLCVADRRPRRLSSDQREQLRTLAAAVMAQLEARRSARRSEGLTARLADVLAASPDAVLSVDAHGAITGWNPAAEALLGWSAGEVLGHDLTELVIPPEHRQAHRAGMARVLAGGESRVIGRPLELTALTRAGTRIDVEISVGRARDPEATGFHAFIRDIRERRAAEAERAHQAERHARILDAAGEGIIGLGADDRVVFANTAACALTGHGVDALMGTSLGALVPGEGGMPDGRAPGLSGPGDGHVRVPDGLVLRADGTSFPASYVITPLDGADGGRVMVFQDTSERTRLLEELAHGRRFLETVLDSMSEGVVACDDDGRLALFNRATREFHGLPEQPLPPEAWARHYDLFRPDGLPMSTEEVPLARAFSGEEVTDAEIVIAPRRGMRRLLRASARPIRADGGRILGAVASMHDITAQREAEDRLRAERDRSAALIGAMQDGIAVIGDDGRVVEANARFLGLVGLPVDEVVGHGPPYPWWRGDAIDGGADLARLVASGRAGEIDGALEGPDGRHLPALVTVAPVRDGEVVVGVKDMTERHELERMKSEFVAVASHELRSPLTAVLGYLQIVADGEVGDLNAQQRHFLGNAMHSALRLKALVADVLLVAQADADRLHIEAEAVDLWEVASAAVQTALPAAAEAGIALGVTGRPGLAVQGDPMRLGQVVDNLVSNALKFTPSGGRVVVAAGRDGDHAEVTVADTGVGIPHAEQGRLFDRFFRSEDAGRRAVPGTGLGLAIVKLIVDAHGGAVRLESAPGEGTRVTFRIPCAAPATVAAGT